MDEFNLYITKFIRVPVCRIKGNVLEYHFVKEGNVWIGAIDLDNTKKGIGTYSPTEYIVISVCGGSIYLRYRDYNDPYMYSTLYKREPSNV